MRARSFSHTGITVSDFNRAVRFYWDVFGCPLVGVSDSPADRVRGFFGVDSSTSLGAGAREPTGQIGAGLRPARLRGFFGVDSPTALGGGAREPTCKIGWIRVPGGAVLEIFEFQPQQPF